MKGQLAARHVGTLLLSAMVLSVLACSLSAPRSAPPATPEESEPILPPGAATPLEGGTVLETAVAPGDTPQPDAPYDLSQAGLPPDFPIYAGAYAFAGIPGMMLEYTVDADVRTTSEFYDAQMKASGWTGFATGGVDEGSCGGDCGPVPTKTPGPDPTATPTGWMEDAFQMWTSGSSMVTIDFSANDAGGTDIAIVFASQ
jgi:hypothetical protein